MTVNHRSAGIGRGVAAAALFGALALSAVPAGSVLGHAAHGHPAKIHNGSCEDLKGVAFELTGVGAEVDADGNPVPETEAVNADSAYQVLRSSTSIETTIDDLLAEPLAIMVYKSDEEMTGIACGNLGGARFEDELAVGLAEVGVPGHVGMAIIAEDPETPGAVTVNLYVGHAMSPVSMSGGADAGHSHDEGEAGHDGAAADSGGDDHSHDGGSGDHHDEDAAATPSA